SMDWDKLRIFYFVAKSGSFTQAANILNISQPALSRSISNLEGRLKIQLFHRHAKGITLTKEGEIIFEAATKMYNDFSQAQQKINENKQEINGQLTIASTAGFAELYLTPCIPAFLEKYPEVILNINANDILPDINLQEPDILIGPYITDQPRLTQELLTVFQLKLYASPGYLKKFGTPLTLKDLDDHRLIGFGTHKINPFLPLNWHLSAGKPEGEVRQPYLQINLASSRCKFAASDLGIITIPCETPELDKWNLIEILSHIPGPVIKMYYIYSEHVKNYRKVQVLGEFLKDTFSKYR
ncbi:MAG: LysR family transcriptional regulator, partial [Alphaproteobacteria bacterium]|nr:LysR family transcriptional regulator [Alphaproteobacteria bacterium]